MSADTTSIPEIARGDNESIQAIIKIATNRSTIATLLSIIDYGLPDGVDVLSLDDRCKPLASSLKKVSIFPESETPSHAVLLLWRASSDELDATSVRHEETTGQTAVAIAVISKGKRERRHMFNECEIDSLSSMLEHEEEREMMVTMDMLASAVMVTEIIDGLDAVSESIEERFKIELVIAGGVTDEAKARVSSVMASVGMKSPEDFVASMNKIGRLDDGEEGCLCTAYHVKTSAGREAVVHACQTLPSLGFSVFAQKELDHQTPHGLTIEIIERDTADKYLREGVNLYTIKE